MIYYGDNEIRAPYANEQMFTRAYYGADLVFVYTAPSFLLLSSNDELATLSFLLLSGDSSPGKLKLSEGA